MDPNINNISDITNVLYINLEHRTDRRAHVESELKKIGLSNFTRMNAIKMDNGSIGCSLSHLKCLRMAKENGWSHVLIVEDDIQFLIPDVFMRQLNRFLSSNTPWDVILIAGNNKGPFIQVNEYAVKVKGCQTTTGYLVSNHYYDKLIQNVSIGIENLLRNPRHNVVYAIDQYWKRLQEEDNWYLITPLTVVQRDGYSDIEKKRVNYLKPMTQLC